MRKAQSWDPESLADHKIAILRADASSRVVESKEGLTKNEVTSLTSGEANGFICRDNLAGSYNSTSKLIPMLEQKCNLGKGKTRGENRFQIIRRKKKTTWKRS